MNLQPGEARDYCGVGDAGVRACARRRESGGRKGRLDARSFESDERPGVDRTRCYSAVREDGLRGCRCWIESYG